MNRKSVLLTSMGVLTAATVQAAAITYLGGDTTTNAKWYSSSVAKNAAFDPNGDNKYGSDGYDAFYSNSATYTTSTPPTERKSLPVYITSVTNISGLATGNQTVYPLMDDPTTGTAVSGAIVAGKNSAVPWDCFQIVLAQNTDFVLGIGTLESSYLSPTDRLRVRQTVGGTQDTGLISTLNPANNSSKVAYYNFFRVSGNAGDTFVVSASRGEVGYSNTLPLLTFEAVPEPTSLALLALAGGVLLRRRS